MKPADQAVDVLALMKYDPHPINYVFHSTQGRFAPLSFFLMKSGQ